MAAGAGLALTVAPIGAAPSPGAPRPEGTQPAATVLYRCVAGTESDVESIGLALCDAEPTPALHERAEQDNLQIRAGALVVEVEKGGSAATEGVEAGDMIYRVAGVDVAGATAAGSQLAGVRRNADTQINFLRRGRPYRIKLRR